MIYEYQFLQSLLFTVIIETSVLFIFTRSYLKIQREKKSNTQLLFAGFICSFATLPYLWFLLPVVLTGRIAYLFIGELFVVFVESFLIYFLLKLTYKQAIMASIACNMSSFFLGMIIARLYT